ncbi:MAG: leucine-rich repeat domain-containing protein [Paludibacteraceae bacterium]|nr:leucine-rich repeat domain-containing protein [Paludibacteraceae bacterium]
MKQIILVVVATLLLSIHVCAQTSGTCGANLTWSYSIPNRTLTISGYGDMTNYDINGNDVPWSTFTGLMNTVVLPEGLTSIGTSAFIFCNYLTSVNIPSSVTNIGDRAFDGCSKLSSITLPEGLPTIGYRTFSGCSCLNAITIPSTITSIGEKAFNSCTGLRSITCLAPQPPTLGANVFYCINKFAVTVSVPSNSRALYLADSQWSAFSRVVGLTNRCGDNLTWTLQDSVLTISGTGGMYHFSTKDSVPWLPLHANEIASVVIEDGVTDIGSHAFYECQNLRAVSIPCSVTTIGEEAFAFCRKLPSISLSDSIISIGADAFECCSGLTSIAIPQGVTTINNGTFYSCSNLASVSLPDSVRSIGNYAFCDCVGLTSISLPPALKSIGKYAFEGCRGLTSIIIPERVTSIGNYCFNVCRNLTSFYLLNPVPFYMDGYGLGVFLAFTWEMWSQQPEFSIYVPCGTLSQYKSTKGWNNFLNQLKYEPKQDYVLYELTLSVQDTLQGSVMVSDTILPTVCDSLVSPSYTVSAAANEGYHFSHWNDGIQDNPRTVVLTQDTSLTAFFLVDQSTNIVSTTISTTQNRKTIINNQLFILLPDGTRLDATGRKVE